MQLVFGNRGALELVFRGRRISFTRLIIYLAGGTAIISLFLIFIVSRIVKERSIEEMGRYEARQVSRLSCEAIYSGMVKGWNKRDITDAIERLNRVRPDMRVRVYRGFPVIEQFGEMPGEREAREADGSIMRGLKGEELFRIMREDIRYIYPVIADRRCGACHRGLSEGMTAGVIDIMYPIRNLRVSMEYLIRLGIIFFSVYIATVFLLFYILLRRFVIRPVLDFVVVIKEITTLQDLNKRVPATSYISEIHALTHHFNKLLDTVSEYYQRLEELSYRDPLTGLYNRRKFEEFLEYEVYRSKRYSHHFSIVMLDIDNFKNINDTFGHPGGDMVLKEIASLIEQNIRYSDIAARVGGDEFAVILPETEIRNGMVVAEKLRRLISETPLSVVSGNVMAHASFGIAEFPLNGEAVNELLTACDVALYRAKHLGRNKVVMIEAEDREVAMDMASKGDFLKRAIEEGRVEPVFQPVVEIATGKVYGFDVLATIVDGDKRIHAKQFILPAEELGYLDRIDEIVLEKALSLYGKAEALSVTGRRPGLFFHSGRRLFRKDFPDEVIRVIEARGISPASVVFQMDEGSVLPRLNDFMEVLERLRRLGIGFALKNFGTGFSSFMYLRYLDVDYVRLDGSFVKNMDVDERNRLIVNHIHQMVARLEIKTIAPQVEDEEVHSILKGLGIDYGIGYYYGAPTTV
ncbi:MAG: hypothetical protein OHK0032_17110 [Thermodesulfovibrionales bacterium]